MTASDLKEKFAVKRVWLGVLAAFIFGTLFDALVPANSRFGNFLGSSGIGLLTIPLEHCLLDKASYKYSKSSQYMWFSRIQSKQHRKYGGAPQMQSW